MFDIGWSEMAIVLLVAIIVIGPRDLPRVARAIGRWTGKARAMAREFQRSLEDMAREAELEDLRKEIEGASRLDLGEKIRETVDPDRTLDRALDFSEGAGREARPASTPSSTPTPAKTESAQGATAAPDATAPAASTTRVDPSPAEADRRSWH